MISLLLLMSAADDALFRLSSSRTPKPLREVLENPSGAKVNAKHLVGMLPLSRRDKDGAMRGFSQGMWEVAEDVLSPFECDEIIEWARPLLSKEFDSVDEAPSFQTDLPIDMTPIDSIFPGFREASAFVRCYSKKSRPRLPFHVDSSCKRSASLNLSPSQSYDGGDLLLFADRDLVRGSRKQGCATIHDANIAHAISDMKQGERWSLVMFQYE